MPLYEYECSDCGTIFDRYYAPKGGRKRYYYNADGKIEDDYPRQFKCNCGGSAKRLISAPAIRDNSFAPWMREMQGTPDNPGAIPLDAKLETRSDFNKYIKENKIRIHRAG